MVTDKPLVSIVMAVYKPNMDWFRQQLKSLNDQTYPNLELLICDDCPEFPVDEKIFSELITNFSFKIFRNEKNWGSSKVFEKLTEIAGGKYISYCDQDDIWFPEKISECYKTLIETKALLVCSDMMIIDSGGNKIAGSITDIRKTHKFYSGDNMFEYLLAKNFVTGCTMLVLAEIAKQAVPFVENMVHDHWIALCAANKGRIETVKKPLLYYRVHGGNQTDFLKNSDNKSDYINERIIKYFLRMSEIQKRFSDNEYVKKYYEWSKARKAYSEKEKGSALLLWKLRNLNKKTTYFELFALRLPDKLFEFAIKIVKKINSK